MSVSKLSNCTGFSFCGHSVGREVRCKSGNELRGGNNIAEGKNLGYEIIKGAGFVMHKSSHRGNG